MLDAAFSWLSAALWTAVFCAYRIRVARHGGFRADRVSLAVIREHADEAR